jgi:TonB-linked SusC/RagA family outer membrane protein
MKKNLIKNIVVVLGLNLLMQLSIFAQDNRITVSVNDETGSPISGAAVTVGEGGEQILTDENGQFTFNVTAKTSILIEAEGYESLLTFAMPPPIGMGSAVLVKKPFLMSEKDVVNIPFGVLKKRQTVGSLTVLDPKAILNYDQQNNIFGALAGRVPGMYGSSLIRGNSSPMIIVDGMPRSAEGLNLEQIDQITVVKDLASSMMYGSQANNGLILITTKRGELLKRTMRVTAENSFNMPISYPKYLGAAEYMGFYNQALANDGLAPLYSDDAIARTVAGSNPIAYPDVDFYNSTFLNNWFNSHAIVGESGGGNEVARYYLNLGWNRNNSLLNLGEGENEKEDNLSLRGNVDYKLNNVISVRFDASFQLDVNKGPRYTNLNFWELASTLKPNYSPLLIPIDLIQDPSVYEGARVIIDDKYLLGGTSEYQNNPYGELTNNGNSTSLNRLMQINTGLDYNFDFITPGLTGSTFLSIDIFNGFVNNLNNAYAIYNPLFVADPLNPLLLSDSISGAARLNNDLRFNDKEIASLDFYRRVGFSGSLNYSRVFNSKHEINSNAIAYYNEYSVERVLQPQNHLHFGLRSNYTFDNKYIAEFSGVIAGSSKLYENNRYTFSPGFGLAWVLSEEGFLSSSSVIDYLKVRANWAVNHTDENIGYYLYMSNYYTLGNAWSYNQGNNSNRMRTAYTGNPNLNWEKNMEYNIGFESVLMNNKLNIDAGYFFNKGSDFISTRENRYPSYLSATIYENYGSQQYQGVEMGLNYRESLGNLKISFGGNFVYTLPKTLEIDEPNYGEGLEYLQKAGQPYDAMYGYVALGLFADSTEILASPYQTFGPVKPGDIRYADLNNDNVIDNRDVKMIGNSRARLGYGVNLNLEFKSFQFFILGTGQSGGQRSFNNPYYWVYGTEKYSETVRNAWTPATAETAAYPRLSTIESNNNFRNSSYWLDDVSLFSIRTVQLTYSFPKNTSFLKESRIFVKAHNIATFSKIKDKLELNVGSAPQFRQISVGLNAAF